MASASTITGGIYTTAPYPANLSPSQTPPGTELGTFTVNQINFYGGPSNSSPSYTVGGFLNSDGSVATISPIVPGVAGLSLDNKELQFFGSNYFAAGTYTITHDDGVFLYLNGTQVVSSGSPTTAETSTFTVGTAGVYSFDLLYAEVNGAPGVLDLPAATTPEPSTFVLLGSGLMSVAGLVRRRMSATR